MPETKEDILEIVRYHVKDRHPGGATLNIVAGLVRHEEDWWYVPIRPDLQPAKRFEYYEALAEAETAIQAEKNISVLLIPVQADELVA